MINKKLKLTASLCSLMLVITVHGTSSVSESNFSRQWGAMGTLHQAPTYFKAYQPKKGSCSKKNHHAKPVHSQRAEQK